MCVVVQHRSGYHYPRPALLGPQLIRLRLATILTPGVVAAEAAVVDVPVLVAMGERDVVVPPVARRLRGISARSAPIGHVFRARCALLRAQGLIRRPFDPSVQGSSP